jgi:hypothetical protein
MSGTPLSNPGNACFMISVVQLLSPIADAINVTAASPVVSRRLAELLNLMMAVQPGTVLSPIVLVSNGLQCCRTGGRLPCWGGSCRSAVRRYHWDCPAPTCAMN